MSVYSVMRGCYQGLIPNRMRRRIYTAMPPRLKRWKRSLVQALERTAKHDEIYDAAYYQQFVEPTMQMSADTMAATLVDTFHPKSVADVGCGTGVLLLALRSKGVKTVGIEYAAAAIDICRKRGLDVHQVDIENDPHPDIRTELVISTEVAEHLPERCADKFVDLLCSIAPTVVLTAATPSVSGTDHVNEQPMEYWIAKFEQRGLRYDSALSEQWRSQWSQAGVAWCFWSTVMIFRRESPSA